MFDLGLKNAEESEEDEKGLRSWIKHLSMWRNMRPTKGARPQCVGLGVARGEAGQVNRNQIAKAFRNMLRNLDLMQELDIGRFLGQCNQWQFKLFLKNYQLREMGY